MPREPGRSRARIVASASLLLLLAGAALPLWTMTLHAPQYINGLRLVIDGRGASGDVDELNELNHYIGMQPIKTDGFRELGLFVPGIAALALGVLLTAVTSWRVIRWLAVFGLWALPVVFLADLQWRLYQFGHSLSREAAFRLPAFTPHVFGPTVVMNFNISALPGLGLILFVLSATVCTFGPRAGSRRVVHSRTAAATAAALGLLAVGLAGAPVRAAAPAAIPAALQVAPAPPAFDLAAAVASAPPGATIQVPPGRYPGPLVLARPVTLIGTGRPVIDAGGRGDVVVIDGDGVRLEGFVIRGSALAYSREASGVVVHGARAVVRNNQIEDVLFGVYLAGATGAVIEANTIATANLPVERRGHAIYLWKAQHVRLLDNRILRAKDGIYVSFSDDNVVERNVVTGCRYGIHYMYANNNMFRSNTFLNNAVGATIMYSTGVSLIGNRFEGSRSAETGAGLIFKDADRLLVRENRIVGNRIGLEFDGVPATIGGWARIERNLIAFNGVGFSLMSTAAITVTENTIVENLRPVQPRGAVRADANQWSVGGRGNHWGDYAGFDAAGDGIGDVPYRRTDLLEDLSDRAPALQAFLFTPAHMALEAAARLVPLVRAEPIVEDQAPLMRPPAIPALAMAGSGAAPDPDVAAARGGAGMMVIGLILFAPSAAAVFMLGHRRRP